MWLPVTYLCLERRRNNHGQRPQLFFLVLATRAQWTTFRTRIIKYYSRKMNEICQSGSDIPNYLNDFGINENSLNLHEQSSNPDETLLTASSKASSNMAPESQPLMDYEDFLPSNLHEQSSNLDETRPTASSKSPSNMAPESLPSMDCEDFLSSDYDDDESAKTSLLQENKNKTNLKVGKRKGYFKLRRQCVKLEKNIKNLKESVSKWKDKWENLREKHQEDLKMISVLKKENQKLQFALNFHKEIVKNLSFYQLTLLRPEEEKFFSSLASISNSFRRAPKGYRNPVNSYFKKKLIQGHQECKSDKFSVVKVQICQFYLDDENSTPSPGKREFITRKKVKKGKRYMTDTQTNLW